MGVPPNHPCFICSMGFSFINLEATYCWVPPWLWKPPNIFKWSTALRNQSPTWSYHRPQNGFHLPRSTHSFTGCVFLGKICRTPWYLLLKNAQNIMFSCGFSNKPSEDGSPLVFSYKFPISMSPGSSWSRRTSSSAMKPPIRRMPCANTRGRWRRGPSSSPGWFNEG